MLDVSAKQVQIWMQERHLLPKDWVKRLQAVEIKFEELRSKFPYKHAEQAVVSVGKKIKEKEREYSSQEGGSKGGFKYSDAQEVFRLLTEETKEGEKNFFGRYKS